MSPSHHPQQQQQQHKSTDNTVFVRFNPPSPEITRFHVSEIFSQVGPIKKCSIIRSQETNKGMGYGFCKFVSQEDAKNAAASQNHASVELDGRRYKLTVELASHSKAFDKNDKKATTSSTVQEEEKNASTINTRKVSTNNTTTDDDEELLAKRKRTSRVIVRNVSFYANEHHIRSVLEKEFGPILELTLPKVSDKLHRGFCFVTFRNEGDAQRAVQQPRKIPLQIKKRPVAIDYSVSKQVHEAQRQKQKQQAEQQKKKTGVEKESSKSDDDSSSSSDDDSDSSDEEEDADDAGETKVEGEKVDQESDDGDDSSSSDEEDSDDDDESESVSDEDDTQQESLSAQESPKAPEHDDAVEDHRSLFCRNLPFDATRHDLFTLFSPFGYIESIYLVKDKNTGVSKGTAFLAFRDAQGAQKALEAAGSSGFVTQREGSASGEAHSGLHLRGRRLFVDVAVDKKTAVSLTVEKQGNKVTGKDRRNLYLKMEGRVANEADGTSSNNNAWENLPESDQLKRQRAFAEKNTKLRSPLFFINSKRLSVRNLAKHVDEAMLKELCVIATRRGLDTNLVTQEDQVAHWRAGGDLTTRDIMKRIEQAKEESGSVIPGFDESNVKRFISSVFIDRDFTTNKKEKAPSRGFGFVDFERHAHALACLRELNNNPYYSASFVTGGKKAVDAKKQARKRKKTDLPKGEFVSEDGRALTPRLIVDFAVENKAKAKKQAEHRAQQQANIEKQRLELKEKKKLQEGKDEKKHQKKKSRGAIQREKKRKQKERLESGEQANEDSNAVDQGETQVSSTAPSERETRQKVKSVKPPKKKRKVDKEEQNFENLVYSYRKAFTGTSELKDDAGVSAARPQSRPKKTDKRWFE